MNDVKTLKMIKRISIFIFLFVLGVFLYDMTLAFISVFEHGSYIYYVNSENVIEYTGSEAYWYAMKATVEFSLGMRYPALIASLISIFICKIRCDRLIESNDTERIDRTHEITNNGDI